MEKPTFEHPQEQPIVKQIVEETEAAINNIEQQENLETPPSWFSDTVSKLADMWFDPKSFESKELYENLGIRKFKKYLPTGELTSKLVWKLTKKNAFIKDGSLESLKSYEKYTRIYETIHLTFIPLMTASMVMSLKAGNIADAAIVAGINTIVNVYPVLLQRYNRGRLYEVIKKKEAKKEEK